MESDLFFPVTVGNTHIICTYSSAHIRHWLRAAAEVQGRLVSVSQQVGSRLW